MRRGRHHDLRRSRDPLELHFQKMTEYPLLTHAGEIALARRIERADLAIVRALLHTGAGREALGELAAGLREGRLRIEDVERNPSSAGGAPGPDATAALAARIEAAVERARRRPRHARSRPPTRGLRLHPRAVSAAMDALTERDSEPARRTLREVERLRRVLDAATAQFVQSNLRIVVTFARRYRGMPLVDLVQEGNLGLLRAVDKYDHRRGLRFSTYAAWWIRHALQRALADQSRVIRLPVHLTGAVSRVRRAQERLSREGKSEPTVEELSARTGLSVAHVRRALDVVAQPVSLDASASSSTEDGADLGELVADVAVPPVDEEVARRELDSDARALLAVLPEREREVIRLRYGVGGDRQRTLEEGGARMSLSRERARQLERNALAILREASEKRRLRSHLDS